MKPVMLYVYSLAVTAALAVLLVERHHTRSAAPEVIEVVRTITDTVIREVPQPVVRIAHRVDTCYLPVLIRDTVRDTVQVLMPIERKEYRDSAYYAVISGFCPSLDYIEVYGRRDCIVQKMHIAEQPVGNYDKLTPFAVHLGAGIAATPKGLQPCVNVSIGIDLYRFRKRR